MGGGVDGLGYLFWEKVTSCLGAISHTYTGTTVGLSICDKCFQFIN